MNPYEPPPPTDDPAWLDPQHPRVLAWMLRLQLVTLSCTAIASLLDTGVDGRFEIWWLVERLLVLVASAGFPLAVVGALLWLVEMIRLWYGHAATYWYLLLEPIVAVAWLWSFLPLMQAAVE